MANTTSRWRRHLNLSIFFSVLSIALFIYSIGTNDLVGSIVGVFLFLVFSTSIIPATHEYAKVKILHRLSLFVLGMLGYYLLTSIVWGIVMLIVGVVGLSDAVYSIMRRKS